MTTVPNPQSKEPEALQAFVEAVLRSPEVFDALADALCTGTGLIKIHQEGENTTVSRVDPHIFGGLCP